MAIFSNNREFMFNLTSMVVPKRQEGQLKNIESVIDRRAWSLDRNEQRQYFYDYIRANEVDGFEYLSALVEYLLKKTDKLSVVQPVESAPIATSRPIQDKEWGREQDEERYEVAREEETDAGQEVIIPHEEDILFRGELQDADKYGLTDEEVLKENMLTARQQSATEPEPISKTSLEKHKMMSKAELNEKDMEIHELKNKLADCMQDLNERDYYLSQAMEKLENLHSILTTNKDLNDKVEIYNLKIQQLQDEKDRLKQGKDDAMDMVTQLERERDLDQSQDLQRQLDEYKAKVETLEEEEKELLHMYLTESKMLLLEVENLKTALNKYKDMEKQLQEMKAKAAEADALRDGLDTDRVADSENQLLEAENKLHSLQKDLEAAQQDRDDIMQRSAEEIENERRSSQKLDEDLFDLKQKSKDLSDERNALQGELNELKEELESSRYQAQDSNSKIDNLKQENELLRSRADEDRQSYTDDCAALEQNLQAMRQERDALQRRLLELEGLEVALHDLEQQLANMQNVIAERDMLRMKLEDLAGLEAELEKLRYKSREADMLRMDRDRLKQALDERAGLEVAYRSLLEKAKNVDVIIAERNMFKSKFEELAVLEVEVKALRNLVDRLKGADEERNCLKRKVKELECGIADQEDEIKRLLIQIERISIETYGKKGKVTETFICRCPSLHGP